jgi:general secretion pathway protein D
VLGILLAVKASTLHPIPSAQAAPACKPVPTDARVAVKQGPIEVGDLVAWISGLTCRSFVMSEKVRTAKVTLLTPGRITAGEAYRAFLSALDTLGLAVQEAGRTSKIIEKERAPTVAIPTYGLREAAPSDDRIITRLARLRHRRADELAPLLAGLKGQQGVIAIDARTNTLVVTDLAANVARLLRIAAELDEGSGAERIYIYRAVHAQASTLADQLLVLLGVAGPGGPSLPIQLGDLRISTIVPDDRTQQIFIVANQAGHQHVKRLLQPVDRAAP